MFSIGQYNVTDVSEEKFLYYIRVRLNQATVEHYKYIQNIVKQLFSIYSNQWNTMIPHNLHLFNKYKLSCKLCIVLFCQ